MRRWVFFILGFVTGSTAFVSRTLAADCISFGRLVPAFTSELSLDAKTAKILFTPLALDPASPKRHAYLVTDRANCSVVGDCDSAIYLSDERGCYRSVLGFRGKWKGIRRTPGREIASVEVESRFEGGAAGSRFLRIERRKRRFDFFAERNQYEEKK
jgi:hypothetical protein